MISPDDRYTKDELFDLWRLFRRQPDVLGMLRDFGGLNHQEALKLHIEFTQRYEDFFDHTLPFYPKANVTPDDWDW